MKRTGIAASLLLSCTVLLWAEQAKVPTSAPEALGLPASTTAMAPVSGPRAEIEALLVQGKKKEAQKKITQWMDKEKDSPWPWVMEARMEYENKNFKRSKTLADKALNKAPDCGEAYYWKGRALEALKKNLEAANEYRAAIIGPHKYPDAQKDLDRVLVTLEQ
jgi:tetratricopeptide (TPR) repeat protein